MLCFIEIPFTPSISQLMFTLMVMGIIITILWGLFRKMLDAHLAKLADDAKKNQDVIDKNTVAVNKLTNTLETIVEKMKAIDDRLENITDRLNQHHDALIILQTQHNSLHPEGCKTAIELSKKVKSKHVKTKEE
jgi:hypothetical protein